MNKALDLKQKRLDLSNAVLVLFDLIDTEGVTAPIDNQSGITKLRAVIDITDEIQGYYYHRNLQRMLALGVSPDSLLKMFKEE